MRTLATVEDAGLATSQDGGRRGFEHVGVPVAGAWHRARYELACRLIGEPVGTSPAIELLAADLILRCEVDLVVVAVGPAVLTVDASPAATGTVVRVHAGQQVRLHHVGPGPVYAAVAGWLPRRILGSCSVDLFSGLGRRLERGDRLIGSPQTRSAQRVGYFHRSASSAGGPVRIVAARAGHEAADFTSVRWEVVSNARSGTRLRAPRWPAPQGSIASMPVLPGAVQVTPAGEAIVLGPDGALTGGYPVVGVVATADLDRISELRTGEVVSFSRIDVAAAVAADRDADRARSRLLVHPDALA